MHVREGGTQTFRRGMEGSDIQKRLPSSLLDAAFQNVCLQTEGILSGIGNGMTGEWVHSKHHAGTAAYFPDVCRKSMLRCKLQNVGPAGGDIGLGQAAGTYPFKGRRSFFQVFLCRGIAAQTGEVYRNAAQSESCPTGFPAEFGQFFGVSTVSAVAGFQTEA